MSQHKINRRKFLQFSAAGAAGLVLASCAPAAAPTTAPEAPKATDTTAAQAQPAEKASPTPIPTQADTATPVPTVEKAKYKESPLLTAQVTAGKLPKVDERLPVNPLVLQPIDATGKYGGRIRSLSTWLGGHWAESQYGHSPLRWINDGMGIAPGMCDTWETNADNTVWTVHVREGLKWSNGSPCTTKDIMFWWNDLVNANYKDAPDSVPDFGQDDAIKGTNAKFEAKDDFTLTITYTSPHPLTAKRLAMWVNAQIGPRWIAPMEYLKQFHPKYNTAVKDFQDLNNKNQIINNPDMPSLNSWVAAKVVPSQSVTWDRNPYYYAVDTEGNQLPYIDGIDEGNVADREVQLVQVLQGSIDFCHFHGFTLGDVGTLKDNEAKGNYTTLLWDSGSGTGMMYFWNYDAADDKKRALYRTPDFKKGMSVALDRARIQKTVYYNTGMLTTGTMSPKAFEFNFNQEAQDRYKKYRDAYVAYDVKQAQAYYEKAGLKKGADGMYTYADGSKLDVRVDVPADAGKECLDVLQIAQQNWKDSGLNIVINQVTPNEFDPGWQAGKLEIHTNWEVGDGPDHLLYPSWVVPNETSRWAPLVGQMILSASTDKANTEKDVRPWDRKPPRFNVDDKEYKGTDVEKLENLYTQAIVEVDEVKRAQLVWQMDDIHYDNLFYMGTVANYPRIIISSKNLTNVPKKEQLKLGGFVNPWIIPYPAVTNTETYAFTNV